MINSPETTHRNRVAPLHLGAYPRSCCVLAPPCVPFCNPSPSRVSQNVADEYWARRFVPGQETLAVMLRF